MMTKVDPNGAKRKYNDRDWADSSTQARSGSNVTNSMFYVFSGHAPKFGPILLTKTT